MILAALAFSGVWLWVGDGERILGPVVIVVAVMGLWALELGRAVGQVGPIAAGRPRHRACKACALR